MFRPRMRLGTCWDVKAPCHGLREREARCQAALEAGRRQGADARRRVATQCVRAEARRSSAGSRGAVSMRGSPAGRSLATTFLGSGLQPPGRRAFVGSCRPSWQISCRPFRVPKHQKPAEAIHFLIILSSIREYSEGMKGFNVTFFSHGPLSPTVSSRIAWRTRGMPRTRP